MSDLPHPKCSTCQMFVLQADGWGKCTDHANAHWQDTTVDPDFYCAFHTQAPGCSVPKVGERGWETSLAVHIKQVFEAHGLAPDSPMFSLFIDAFEKQGAGEQPPSGKGGLS